MNVVDFRNMYSLDYNLKCLFAMNQRWKDNRVFAMWNSPRPTNALLYFKNCAATFTFPDNEKLYVKQNSLVYIPQGALYKIHFYQCGNELIHTQLLEFVLTNEEKGNFVAANKITLLPLPKTYNIGEVFDEIIAIYNKPFFSYSKLKSHIYTFLHEICKTFHYERIYSKKYLPIAAGIAYLEHDHSYKLSIAEIAQMCHVSETCFRKLFQQYSGMSPTQHRTLHQLRQAKALLRNGDLTINEIALHLGFMDASYFSRWFKKNTGTSPTSYMLHYKT